jgi:hypothetical protein
MDGTGQCSGRLLEPGSCSAVYAGPSIKRDSATANPDAGDAALKIMWKEIQHVTRITIRTVNAQIDALIARDHMQQMTLPALSGQQ